MNRMAFKGTPKLLPLETSQLHIWIAALKPAGVQAPHTLSRSLSQQGPGLLSQHVLGRQRVAVPGWQPLANSPEEGESRRSYETAAQSNHFLNKGMTHGAEEQRAGLPSAGNLGSETFAAHIAMRRGPKTTWSPLGPRVVLWSTASSLRPQSAAWQKGWNKSRGLDCSQAKSSRQTQRQWGPAAQKAGGLPCRDMQQGTLTAPATTFPRVPERLGLAVICALLRHGGYHAWAAQHLPSAQLSGPPHKGALTPEVTETGPCWKMSIRWEGKNAQKDKALLMAGYTEKTSGSRWRSARGER